jgi:hypothetical protein
VKNKRPKDQRLTTVADLLLKKRFQEAAELATTSRFTINVILEMDEYEPGGHQLMVDSYNVGFQLRPDSANYDEAVKKVFTVLGEVKDDDKAA